MGYGFGNGYDKMLLRMDDFHPLQVPGSQLYIPANIATPSLATDLSPNGYSLSQGTVLQQPTIVTNGDGGKSINFDGSVQNQFLNIANVFGSDSVGSIFFSGYVNTLGTTQTYLTSADTATITRFIFFGIRSVSNKLVFQINNGGTTILLEGSTILTAGNYFFAEFRQDGTGIRIFLRGVEETVTALTGANASNLWWNFATLRDNLTIGALIRNTTSYGASKINKIYYNNTILSASMNAKIEAFMAAPTNY